MIVSEKGNGKKKDELPEEFRGDDEETNIDADNKSIKTLADHKGILKVKESDTKSCYTAMSDAES